MSHRTPAVQQGEKRLERKLAVALKTIGKSVANRLAHLGKAEEEEDPAARAVEAIDWDPVVEAAETELTLVARDGAKRALAEIDIDDESIIEQTFTSAVEFAKARAAELVGKSWDEDGELIDNPDADMAISDSMREDLRDAIAQAVEDGDSAAELSDRIEELAAFSAERADLIARTECLLGNTTVDAAVVRAAFRRRYHGDVIEMVTAGGRKLTATPNHPMLTRRGWVAAGELSDLDDLLCDGRKQNLGVHGDEHEYARPSTIAEVFGALLDAGPLDRYAGSRLEFHGDGMDGDVDVVRIDWELMIGSFTEIRQPSANILFAEANHKTMPAFCTACGRLLTVDQKPCFCRRTNFCAGHLESVLDAVPIYTESLAERRQRHASTIEARYLVDGKTFYEGRRNEAAVVLELGCGLSVSDDTSAMKRREHAIHFDSEFHCDGRHTHTGQVEAIRQLGINGRQLGEARFAPSPEDAGLNECLSQPRRVDSEPFRDNMKGDSGLIEFDRLVSIKRLPFIGHVYNLETPYGYFCVGGGAYTGNTIRAHAQGQMSAMRESGVVQRKAWSTSEDGDVCEDCVANEEQGDIDIDDDFDSGDDAPPCHPNDRCSVVAVVSDESDDEAASDDDETDGDDENATDASDDTE